MIDNTLKAEVEPDYCAQARIIDAASWLVKASAQISCIEGMDELSHNIEVLAVNLLIGIEHKRDKAVIGKFGHELMTSHALLNAAGHAWYARSKNAEALLKEAKDSLHSMRHVYIITWTSITPHGNSAMLQENREMVNTSESDPEKVLGAWRAAHDPVIFTDSRIEEMGHE